MATKKNKKVYHKKKLSVARAISPKTRFVVKTPAEFQELFALSTRPRSEGAEVGQCWFSDPGNPDQCVPLTEEECKSQGGTWAPGDCPNSFRLKAALPKLD